MPRAQGRASPWLGGGKHSGPSRGPQMVLCDTIVSVHASGPVQPILVVASSFYTGAHLQGQTPNDKLIPNGFPVLLIRNSQ